MKNVLITGGAGFIGSNLSLALLDKDYVVTVIDNLSPQVHSANPDNSPLYRTISKRVNFIRGDVTDRKRMTEVLAHQDVVVHLAAETGTGQSMYEIERYNRVNVGGTALLLDILANTKHNVRKLVIASSRAVYGEGKYLSRELGVVYPLNRSPTDMAVGNFAVLYPGCSEPPTAVATDEESKIHPSSVYGITKSTQEQLVMTVCPGLEIAPVAFRYQNVYGPGQSLSNPYTGILSIFANLIIQRKPLNIFEDGLESRDFVYVDDVVRATALGIENTTADNHVFNVGSGHPITVATVAKTLCEKLGIEVPIRTSGNFRIGDIRHNYACLKKIRQLLGFEPKYDFAGGIERFGKWVSSMDCPYNDYDKSLAEMKAKGLLK